MTVGKVALPAWDEIKRQHELIVQRMVDAYHVDPYHEIFSGKACDLPTEYYGTEIMRVIFMEERFHKDCHDWLYIFNHCVLKTVNEAVVEGMGSIVDKHADPKRGLSQDRYVKESIIDWNSPQTHECEGFLCAALNKHFKGEDWNFSSSDKRHGRYQVHTDSAVIDRLKKIESKKPFLV